MTFTFDPLNDSHFPLLLKWLETDHVKKWWDQDVTYTMDLVRNKYSSYAKSYKVIEGASKPIFGFIIQVNQKPVGYIQIYNAYDFPRNQTLSGLPENLGAVDLFIGEAGCLGQNVGSTALSEFLKIQGKAYSHIFSDPDPSNFSGIKCFEKAGFKKMDADKSAGELWMIKPNRRPSST